MTNILGIFSWTRLAVALLFMIMSGMTLTGFVPSALAITEEAAKAIDIEACEQYKDQVTRLKQAAQLRNAVSLQSQTDAFRAQERPSKIPCLGKLIDAYEAIAAIIAALGDNIGALIWGAVIMVLNFICEAVLTVINNVLAKLCIPLPDMGLGYPNLPGLNREYCNGVQLTQFAPGDPITLPSYLDPREYSKYWDIRRIPKPTMPW